jgi:DMSO/TMAO reductase YedYZ molybdopterin-dependent catalytic subunit
MLSTHNTIRTPAARRFHPLLAVAGRFNPLLSVALYICAFIFTSVASAPVATRAQASPPSPAAQSASPAAALTISGAVDKSLSLSLDDLAKLPHTTLKVTHNGKDETFDGVPLWDLLKQAGVPPTSTPHLAHLGFAIVAVGADGYDVAFALAELNPEFEDSGILVADKLDGQPIGAKLGPLRLVVPHDKKEGRWVRNFISIEVVNVSK